MSSNKDNRIHSTVIIDPSAQIAEDVAIGAYTVIGPNVTINSGTYIDSHVVINKCTQIGRNNKIYQFASIGADPQDLHYQDEESYLYIGDNNVFHQCVTISRGTAKQDRKTVIGNDNLFMAYSHVAHDCSIGNHNIFANGATLAGHINMEHHGQIGAFCAVHQFCNIGSYSFISHGAMISKDVLPYLMVIGNDAKTYGLNTIGLQRNGFSKEAISNLQKAYKIIFRNDLTLVDALAELRSLEAECTEISLFISGIERAKRGILR